MSTHEQKVAYVDSHDSRVLAKQLIDKYLNRTCGMSSSDLSDSTIFMNGLDEIENLLNEYDFKSAHVYALDTAREMIEDEHPEFGIWN
jgi:hypothetical protein